MEGASTRIAAAARSGAGFAAVGWRDAWAPLTFIAGGQATAFASAHLDIPNATAGRMQLCGWLLSGLALLPALGALYRSAVGGPALKQIGWGGFQVREVERGLLGAGLLLAVASAAAAAVLLLAGGAVWYPLRNAGTVRLPLIGPFGLWFLTALPVLLIVGWVLLIGLSRLALILPAVAGERRLQLGRVLRGSRRWSGSLASSTLLLEVAPLLGVVAVVQSLSWLERGQAGGLPGAVWPTPDAIAAGVVLSFFYAFLLLPMGVGARTYFYGRVLAEERAVKRRRAGASEVHTVLRIVAPSAEAKVVDPDADAIVAEFEDVAATHPSEAASEEKDAEVAVAADSAAGEDAASGVSSASAQVEDESAPPAAVQAKVASGGGGGRWVPPVQPLRGVGLAQVVTTPILLAHANDRDLPPPWWMPPEHPEGPPVA